jgi:hypothetical protein
MHANAQLLLDNAAAARTHLACVSRIHLHDTTPGAHAIRLREATSRSRYSASDAISASLDLVKAALAESNFWNSIASLACSLLMRRYGKRISSTPAASRELARHRQRSRLPFLLCGFFCIRPPTVASTQSSTGLSVFVMLISSQNTARPNRCLVEMSTQPSPSNSPAIYAASIFVIVFPCSPCVPALLQSRVVQLAAQRQRCVEFRHLRATWVDAVFVRLHHGLLSLQISPARRATQPRRT